MDLAAEWQACRCHREYVQASGVRPGEALATLRAAATDGRLDVLCERHRIRVLTVFGSAVSRPDTARDLDIAVAKYEAAGVPAYWIADPVAGRMVVLERGPAGYVQHAVVEREDVRLERPFPVTVHLRGLPES